MGLPRRCLTLLACLGADGIHWLSGGVPVAGCDLDRRDWLAPMPLEEFWRIQVRATA
jgi:hypothetical protein